MLYFSDVLQRFNTVLKVRACISERRKVVTSFFLNCCKGQINVFQNSN